MQNNEFKENSNNDEFENEEKDTPEYENNQEKKTFKNGKSHILWIVGVAGTVIGIIAGVIGTNIFNHFAFYRKADNIYDKIATVNNILENEYLYDYDKEELVEYAAMGMTIGLGDPYTVYYPKEDFQAFTDDGNGDFVGIGIVIVADPETNSIIIESVVRKGPAEIAGILPGDIIKSVDGEEFNASEHSKLVAKIKGAEQDGKVIGKSVKLTVVRDGQELEFDVVREKIHSDSVESKIIEDGIGYMKISGFNTSDAAHKDTYEEFKTHFEELSKAGMNKLVIDLRNNGGGDLRVVADIIDMIVPEGAIIYSEDKYGNRSYLYSDEKEINIPIVMIVNEYSASASELMTGTLRDYDKCDVVGKTTYGKGVMQNVYPLSDGSGMVVTVAKYYTPKGTCVQDVGITPDYIVELESDKPLAALTLEEDTQLQKAVEVLKTKD